MTDLDTPCDLMLILSNLPYKLWELWTTKACEIQENSRQRFRHIVKFLKKQSKISLDPVFGSIQDSATKVTRTTELEQPATKKSFATTIVPVTAKAWHIGGSTSESYLEIQTQPTVNYSMLFPHRRPLYGILPPDGTAKVQVEFLKTNVFCMSP